MSSNVHGGKIYGKWDDLGSDHLYQGRDVSITTDFRDVIGSVLDRHMGLDQTKLNQIFPDYKRQSINIV